MSEQAYNETYFTPFREQIIGFDQQIDTPYGKKPLVYADWTASGRLYGSIEHTISQELGKWVANTHTETNFTGSFMTQAYHAAQQIIKAHVHASPDDVLINTGSGMTAALAKLQRIMGYKIPSAARNFARIPQEFEPVVFVTHMEHHSNQTSWFETVAHVELIKADGEGRVDLNHLKSLLHTYKDRKIKIASVTACSNVTGIQTPYHEIASLMHANNGFCFVDFACSAPYVPIDMHPADVQQSLDAIFFSPHKFLGGPGTSGVLIFNKKLYDPTQIPDQPGGGTVTWTNPWGGHRYYDDIEVREDGGTPAFMQTIKTALCIRLKEQIGTEAILSREHQMVAHIFERLSNIPYLHILASNIQDRLGVISFYIDGLHYNLGVKLLNDRYGIQVRGGCSCAGTYGHYLLNVAPDVSKRITDKIDHGDLTEKPGWIRMSIHPTMTDRELDYILDAITALAANYETWSKDYNYYKDQNAFFHKHEPETDARAVFNLTIPNKKVSVGE